MKVIRFKRNYDQKLIQNILRNRAHKLGQKGLECFLVHLTLLDQFMCDNSWHFWDQLLVNAPFESDTFIFRDHWVFCC